MVDRVELVDFFADWDKWKSKRDLYNMLSHFFKQLDESSTVTFFGLKLENSDSAKVRRLWSNDGIKRATPKMSQVAFVNSESIYYRDFDKGHCIYYFYLGKNEHQRFVGELLCRSTLDREIEAKLFQYLYNGFNRLLYFTDRKNLLKLAYTDDVTGYFNQRKLSRDLESLGKEYQESCKPFSVLFVDIDHFKNINDNYGHIIGSELLRRLSKRLQTVLRLDDMLYRYGGDEFVLLLPSTGRSDAKFVGQRITDVVKGEPFVMGENSFSLSISVGVAQYPDDAADTQAVLELADKMMYEAKCKGRGRVCCTAEIFDFDKGKE